VYVQCVCVCVEVWVWVWMCVCVCACVHVCVCVWCAHVCGGVSECMCVRCLQIHNIKKPSEALRSQIFVFQAVVKVIKGAKGWQRAKFCFQTDPRKGHIRCTKGTMPSLR